MAGELTASAKPNGARLRLVAGILAGLLLPLFAAEYYVRLKPPHDLEPYLGDFGKAGIYRPDPILRVDYRSIDDYTPFEAPRLADLKPLNTEQPTWLFFGNSFAGGLSGSARAQLRSHRVLFFREVKDELHMRIAQLRLLLENGLKPERVFFTIIPIEVARYVIRPLDWVYVNRQGAISSKYNSPGEPINTVLEQSWLARLAWVRSKLHLADPTYRMSRITESVPATAIEDFRTLFNALGEVSRKHGVPVTVVTLPDRRQILGESSFALQEQLSALIKSARLDKFDPSEVFLAYSDKRAIFLPDWHYTPIGSKLLLEALLKHLARPESVAAQGGSAR
jgi:hypothetical protein